MNDMLRMKAYSLLKMADAMEAEASTCRTQETKSSGNRNGASDFSNFMNILEEEQKRSLGLARSSLSEEATTSSKDGSHSSDIPFDEHSQGKKGRNNRFVVETRDDSEEIQFRRQLGQSEERVKAASHLPGSGRSESERVGLSLPFVDGRDNAANLAQTAYCDPDKMRAELSRILADVRVKPATHSNPLKTRTEPIRPVGAEKAGPVNLLYPAHSDTTETSHQSLRDDHIELPKALHQPYYHSMADDEEVHKKNLQLPYPDPAQTRAALSRSLGPYLYSQIHSSQDPMRNSSLTIRRSSSFLEPSPPLITTSFSTDSDDDSHEKLRGVTESTIDSTEQSSVESGNINPPTHRVSRSLPTTPRSALSGSTFEFFDQDKIASAGVTHENEPPFVVPLVKDRDKVPEKSSSNDQRSIGSGSISSSDKTPSQQEAWPIPKSAPMCRPPIASRKHLQKQGTKHMGKEGNTKQRASQGKQTPRRSKSAELPSQSGSSMGLHETQQTGTEGRHPIPQTRNRPRSYSASPSPRQSDAIYNSSCTSPVTPRYESSTGMPQDKAQGERTATNNPVLIVSTPLNSSGARGSTPCPSPSNALEHQSHSPEDKVCQRINQHSTQTAADAMQAPEKQQHGQKMFDRIKATKNSHSGKTLTLAMQANHDFHPPPRSPVQKQIEPQTELPPDLSGSLPPDHPADLRAKQKLSGQQTVSDTSQLKQHLRETDKTEASQNVMMLQECFSAIVTLKEAAESKYQTLESNYLELKGSFSQLETANKRLRNGSTTNGSLEVKYEMLETRHREMQNKMTKLVSQNQHLLKESVSTRSWQNCIKDSFEKLENENRALKDAAAERDDKHSELQDQVGLLEEKNSQLTLEIRLSKQLELQCQSIEERCVLLQEGLSDLEAANMKLKQENSSLQSKTMTMEAERHNWKEADSKLESHISQTKVVEDKCRQLEDSKGQLESDKQLLASENHCLQSRLQALEAKNLVLEEAKDQLQSQANVLYDEKHEFQSKFQAMERKCQALEESNSKDQSQQSLMKGVIQSRLLELESKCQDLEKRNCAMKSEARAFEDGKLEFQSKLCTMENRVEELEGSNSQLRAQNLHLEEVKEQLQVNLRAIESKTLELGRSNKKAVGQMEKLKVKNHDVEAKLKATAAKCIALEKSNCHLKAHNLKLEGINQAIKAMQASLECSPEEASKYNKNLSYLTTSQKTNQTGGRKNESEAEDIISCLSSDQSSSNCESSYEVLPAQELQSTILIKSANENTRDPPLEQKTRTDTFSGRDKNFENELRDKLNQLTNSGSSEEDPRSVEGSDGCEEQQNTTNRVGHNERRKHDSVSGAVNGESAKRQYRQGPSLRSQSQKLLLPQSPLSLASPRPPLPPTSPSAPHHNSEVESKELQQNNAEVELQTSSSDFASMRNEARQEAPISLSSSNSREQTQSSISQEIMHEPNDEEGTYVGREVEIRINTRTPLSPGQLSKRSRKHGGRQQESRLTKSSVSSPIMVTLFGAISDPQVALEDKRHCVRKEEIQTPRSPLRRKPAARQRMNSPGTSCDEESNSIVTHSTTQTKDLLNKASRIPKKASDHSDLPLVKVSANNQSVCDWFMPLDSSPSEELPVAPRPNIEVRCDPSGCGVGALLPTSCPSALARRTWNYGKKQSRTGSGQHLISNSEQSSIVSVTSNPTATSTTLLAGVGTLTTKPGGTTSFESNNTSDNGSTISTKFLGTSTIRAKRERLRRKQGHNLGVQSSSSSGSSQSEKQTQKPDKKTPRPLSAGGAFPFL